MVLDKRKLSTLVGLLHVCWQNMKRVRRDYTFWFGDGDERNSWWMGFELAAAAYTWEGSYAGTIGWGGWQRGKGGGEAREGEEVWQGGKKKTWGKVCGNTNLHLDERDRPLWYSGGLPKNKEHDASTFEVPRHWIVGGELQQGQIDKGQLDCVVGDSVESLDVKEMKVLKESIELAKEMDGVTRMWYTQDGAPR